MTRHAFKPLMQPPPPAAATAALLLLCLLAAGCSAAQLQQQQQPASETAPLFKRPGRTWRDCDSEQQVVMCGQIPLGAEFSEDRLECCRMHRPAALPAEAAVAVAAAEAERAAGVAQASRGDLGGDLASAPDYLFGRCTTAAQASVPTFAYGGGVSMATFNVPRLSRSAIQRVKAQALSRQPDAVRADATAMRTVGAFVHPGTIAGPMELALMKQRLRASHPIATRARDSLLWGSGVPPKNRVAPDGSYWAPPTDSQPERFYGPLAMPKISIKWSGINSDGVTCPYNYPSKAPSSQCGHISFVELDAQMSIKLAMAYHVTGEDRYAAKALQILQAWADTNREWGVRWENGPLESGWGIAAMARALELLRARAGPGLVSKFVSWVNAVPMKDMDDYYSKTSSTSMMSNWHASIAEAMMSVGVLADDRWRYDRGVQLYHATVRDYLKWGWAQGRIPGECTETLRDMYHAAFGIGSLLQCAEIAWQQDEDLYSSNGYALAAALELHARVTNAYYSGQDTNRLPQGFRFYSTSMPSPPCSGCKWQFDISKQMWKAVDSRGQWVSDLNDGKKYILGAGFLPTGWEVGYNHFVGRLGMRLPETAQLLAGRWPEWQEFNWGLGTITHAHTAQALWRDGLRDSTLCGARGRSRGVNGRGPGAEAAFTEDDGAAAAEQPGAAQPEPPQALQADGLLAVAPSSGAAPAVAGGAGRADPLAALSVDVPPGLFSRSWDEQGLPRVAAAAASEPLSG